MSRRSEAGVSLLGLMVAVSIMSVGLMVALPGWKYVIQDDREQELIFRGNEIARAIERYQTKNNGAMPASLDVLVKGKFLRRRYKEPFTREGNWKRIAPGQMVGAGGSDPLRQGLGRGNLGTPTSQPKGGLDTGVSSSMGSAGRELGPFAGVATTHKGESLRLFNGRSNYEEWTFVAGQPRIVGTGAGLGSTPNIPGLNQPAAPQPPPNPNSTSPNND